MYILSLFIVLEELEISAKLHGLLLWMHAPDTKLASGLANC